jgi:signal transduction histidine kinase
MARHFCDMANSRRDQKQPDAHQERRLTPRRSDDFKLLQHDRQLQGTGRICQSFFQTRNINELIEKVLQTALDVVGAEAGSVLLADYDTERLVFRHVIGARAEQVYGTSIPWHKGIAGDVFKTGRAAVISDVKQDPRHFPDVDLMADYKTRDMITQPLKQWDGDPIGVLNVLNKRAGILNEDDLAPLTIIATFAALAIQQARHFEEAKLAEIARLVADIGHDLRNLHYPVVAGTELLQSELDEIFGRLPSVDAAKNAVSQECCDEVIETIQTSCRRIQERIKQIGDCVKGLTCEPVFAPCSAADVVEAVFKTLRLVAKERDISLRAEDLADLPRLMADEQRLFNAFYNLVYNALPEVPAGGSITIRGQLELGDGVLLSVTDTGRGMPPEVQKSLFSRRTISRKPGGIGLGTKIVKDVVDAHKGTIRAESQEGVGTTFFIRLPLDPTGLNKQS